MTDIPKPAVGDTSWDDWATDEESMSDAVRDILQGATYLPAPAGGDDTAMFTTAFVGQRDIHLWPGATYRLLQRDVVTSASGFTGRVIGNGATLKFEYNSTYSDTYSAISGLTDVKFQDLSITAPGANLFSIFRNCTNLHLENITIFGCSVKMTYAMPKDFTARNIRWITRGTNPATVDGSFYVCDAGRFILEDFDYDTIFNAATGAIVSAVATTPVAGATVYVANGRALTADLTGYSIDGFVDIEPIGTVPFESVTVRDCVFYNTSNYLTGARNITVDNVTMRYTTHNTSGRAIPWVVYNNNTTHPALGSLQVQNCRVEYTSGNPVGQVMAIYTHQGQAGSTVAFKNNRYTFSPSVGQTVQAFYWIKDNGPKMLVLDGESIQGVGTTLMASGQIVQTDSTPDRLLWRNTSIDGTFNRRLVQVPDGGGGNGAVYALDGNDFSRAVFNTADYRDAGITITKLHSANNAGIEY